MPVGVVVVVGGDDRVGRLGHAAVGDRAELVLVDRPLQRLAETPVLEDGVAQLRTAGVAVEAELIVAVDVHRPGFNAGHVRQDLHLRLEQAGQPSMAPDFMSSPIVSALVYSSKTMSSTCGAPPQ